MPSYGLIVEGDSDIPVFEVLTRRIDAPTRVISIQCGGVKNLMKKFPGFLRYLEHADNGAPVDKVLVIRDCDGAECPDIEAAMEAKISGQTFRFPHGVQFCAIRQETETFLIADEIAISSLAVGKRISRVGDPLERIVDAKATFRQMLAEGRLLPTKSVLTRLANVMNLETLRQRVPSFSRFERRV